MRWLIRLVVFLGVIAGLWTRSLASPMNEIGNWRTPGHVPVPALAHPNPRPTTQSPFSRDHFSALPQEILRRIGHNVMEQNSSIFETRLSTLPRQGRSFPKLRQLSRGIRNTLDSELEWFYRLAGKCWLESQTDSVPSIKDIHQSGFMSLMSPTGRKKPHHLDRLRNGHLSVFDVLPCLNSLEEALQGADKMEIAMHIHSIHVDIGTAMDLPLARKVLSVLQRIVDLRPDRLHVDICMTAFDNLGDESTPMGMEAVRQLSNFASTVALIGLELYKMHLFPSHLSLPLIRDFFAGSRRSMLSVRLDGMDLEPDEVRCLTHQLAQLPNLISMSIGVVQPVAFLNALAPLMEGHNGRFLRLEDILVTTDDQDEVELNNDDDDDDDDNDGERGTIKVQLAPPLARLKSIWFSFNAQFGPFMQAFAQQSAFHGDITIDQSDVLDQVSLLDIRRISRFGSISLSGMYGEFLFMQFQSKLRFYFATDDVNHVLKSGYREIQRSSRSFQSITELSFGCMFEEDALLWIKLIREHLPNVVSLELEVCFVPNRAMADIPAVWRQISENLALSKLHHLDLEFQPLDMALIESMSMFLVRRVAENPNSQMESLRIKTEQPWNDGQILALSRDLFPYARNLKSLSLENDVVKQGLHWTK